MPKKLLALAAASLICIPEVSAGESKGRKAQDGFLPSPAVSTPWLDIDRRSLLPRGNYPLGQHADGIGRLVLQPVPRVLMSSNEDQGWRM